MANQSKTITITLVRSTIGRPANQRNTVKALGLKKLHQSVQQPDNEAIRGMVKTIQHLVTVQE